MARTVSIRQSLMGNLVVVIVLLSAAILATTFIGARTLVRTLSGALIARAIDQANDRLATFFDPLKREALRARSWGESGLLDPGDPDLMNDLFLPMIEQSPEVSSVMIADERGREYMLLLAEGRWRNRLVRRDEWGDRPRLRDWTAAPGEFTTSPEPLDYDPRTRPWFEGAVRARETGAPRVAGDESASPRRGDRPPTMGAPGEQEGHDVHWTEPYKFFTTREPGITASVTYEAADGILHVIGFDVLLRDISEFTAGLEVSENGLAFVLTEDLKFIGLPRRQLWSDPARADAALLEHPEALGIRLVDDAVRAFRGRADAAEGPIRFVSDGQAWWGATSGYALSRDRVLGITVMVPESDILGNLRWTRLWILLITATVLIVALVRARMLAARYSRPIENLVRQSDRMSRGDLEGGESIESNVTEVRRLADAHDRMREGLRALMKLERDLQLARQIQQGTFPDRLPEVRGFEIAAWSEPAEETGGDTYDVIGIDTADPKAAPEAARGLLPITTEQAGQVVLLLADATGHGIGPALSVTQIRSMLRAAVRLGQELPRIAGLLNEELCADLPPGRFITAWLGKLDGERREIRTFSAGQAPILRYVAAEDRFEQSDADTVPFGILPDLSIEPMAPIPMSKGDLFVVLSDGIYEAADPGGVLFGVQRVQDVIHTHRREAPQRIVEAIRAAVAAFTEGAPAADDMTGIVIKRT